ncbi:MAG: glycosyltransferase family 2 protein [Actinobacteria bacterium]|nr:glycosyltransferase family 2 protein [Actinomycetota bacterium]
MPDVILPVLDEATAIPWVLARIPPGYRPIVVDNGSSDGSADVARRAGAIVVEEPRRGFGAACYAGLLVATADLVCVLDGDGSLDPGELPRLAAPLDEGRADLVIGARQPLRGAWPVHARFANRVLAMEVRRRTGLRLHDLGPMRVARRAALLGLGLTDRRFGWPVEMVLRASAAGWRVLEMPVSYRPRMGGRSKVSGSLKGSIRAVADTRRVMRRALDAASTSGGWS